MISNFKGQQLYVSGPMTGLKDFNFPAFDAVTKLCWIYGADEVYSPAQHDRDTVREVWGADASPSDFPGYADGVIADYFDAVTSGGKFTLAKMLQWDLDIITNTATGLVMLPGWERSTGARYERLVAEALGKQLYLALPRRGDWAFVTCPNQMQLTTFLRQFAEPGVTGVCG